MEGRKEVWYSVGSCVHGLGDWVGDSAGCTVGICVGGCEGNCVGDAVGGRVGVAVQRQHELIANAHQHDADGQPRAAPPPDTKHTHVLHEWISTPWSYVRVASSCIVLRHVAVASQVHTLRSAPVVGATVGEPLVTVGEKVGAAVGGVVVGCTVVHPLESP